MAGAVQAADPAQAEDPAQAAVAAQAADPARVDAVMVRPAGRQEGKEEAGESRLVAERARLEGMH